MKKFLLALSVFIFSYSVCFANEMTEDYFDIATNFCIEGNYREAANYLDKILLIEPENKSVQNLRNGIRQIIQGRNTSFILSNSSAVKQSIEARKIGNRQGEINALACDNNYWAYYFLGKYSKPYL